MTSARQRTCAAALCVATVAAALVVWPGWEANLRINDPNWLSRATPADIAERAQTVLRYPIGNHHDACLLLAREGDASAVPILKKAVARSPDDNDCGVEHCRAALRTLLSRDVGMPASDTPLPLIGVGQ